MNGLGKANALFDAKYEEAKEKLHSDFDKNGFLTKSDFIIFNESVIVARTSLAVSEVFNGLLEECKRLNEVRKRLAREKESNSNVNKDAAESSKAKTFSSSSLERKEVSQTKALDEIDILSNRTVALLETQAPKMKAIIGSFIKKRPVFFSQTCETFAKELREYKDYLRNNLDADFERFAVEVKEEKSPT